LQKHANRQKQQLFYHVFLIHFQLMTKDDKLNVFNSLDCKSKRSLILVSIELKFEFRVVSNALCIYVPSFLISTWISDLCLSSLVISVVSSSY